MLDARARALQKNHRLPIRSVRAAADIGLEYTDLQHKLSAKAATFPPVFGALRAWALCSPDLYHR